MCEQSYPHEADKLFQPVILRQKNIIWKKVTEVFSTAETIELVEKFSIFLILEF